jgi:hypothetical protein
MGKLWLWIIGVVVIAQGSAGCDFRRVVVNDPISQETLQNLNHGENSLTDIVQVLGAPDEIDAKARGMVLRYRYGDSKTMRVNFGWLLRIFLPVAPSMNLGRGEGVTQVLHIAMNEAGTFDHYFVQDPPAPPRFWFWPF